VWQILFALWKLELSAPFFNLYTLLLNRYQQILEVFDYEQREIFVSYLPCATTILTSK